MHLTGPAARRSPPVRRVNKADGPRPKARTGEGLWTRGGPSSRVLLRGPVGVEPHGGPYSRGLREDERDMGDMRRRTSPL